MAEEQNPGRQQEQEEEEDDEQQQREKELNGNRRKRINLPHPKLPAFPQANQGQQEQGLLRRRREERANRVGSLLCRCRNLITRRSSSSTWSPPSPSPSTSSSPIWKSVAASYGPHHSPSFVGMGNLCSDFGNIMEPEPGRCRRTDGKKWRCSSDVVSDTY